MKNMNEILSTLECLAGERERAAMHMFLEALQGKALNGAELLRLSNESKALTRASEELRKLVEPLTYTRL